MMKYPFTINGLSKDWSEFSSSDDSAYKAIDYIEGVNHINLLVGPNSSRKSRFCRRFFQYKELMLSVSPVMHTARRLAEKYLVLLESFPVDGIQILVTPITTIEEANFNAEKFPALAPARRYAGELGQKPVTINRGTLENIMKRLNNWTQGSEDLIDLVRDVRETAIGLELALAYESIRSIGLNIDNFIRLQILTIKGANPLLNDPDGRIKPLLNISKEFVSLEWSMTEMQFTYVPTLRGAQPIAEGSDKSFQAIDTRSFARTIEACYNLKDSANLQISTGLDLYAQIARQRNTKQANRRGFEAFQTFLSARFFGGKPLELIADYDSKTILINIDGDSERELHDVGDGIQSLIVLLFPIFTSENGRWLFIEEPEVHLHPGFQTLFLETLIGDDYLRTKELTFFVTTHSNHLLDYSLTKSDAVSIFTFTPGVEASRHYSSVRKVNGTDTSILDLLGVANSSVFLAHCSIWVEGISDRIILRAYLKALLKHKREEFIEDLHYSFLEYAGSNIRHYTMDVEAKEPGQDRIRAFVQANRIWMLADRDDSNEKRKFHRAMSALARKSFVYMTTKAREIENTLPVEVLTSLLSRAVGEDSARAKFHGYDHVANKNRRMGEVLSSLSDRRKRVKYAEANGSLTTYYKLELAKELSASVEKGELTWSEIAKNRYAKEITISLYEFLKKNIIRR